MRKLSAMLDRQPTGPSRLSVGWVGPTTGPCGKLIRRIEQHSQAARRTLDLRVQSSLDLPQLLTCDRIIVSCPTRLDYPLEWLEVLTLNAPEIPWAVVTDHWHAGSRRSGLGVTTHWMQPWYRWWEGWLTWLFPDRVRPGATPPGLFQSLTLPSDMAASAHAGSGALTNAVRPSNTLIGLACACPLTAQSWQLMAGQVGCQVVSFGASAVSLNDPGLPHAANFKYMLWDDSLLSCLPYADVRQQLLDQLSNLRRELPDASMLVGLSLCHLDLYDSALVAGASDILIKPSYGLPLADYLYYHLDYHLDYHLATSDQCAR